MNTNNNNQQKGSSDGADSVVMGTSDSVNVVDQVKDVLVEENQIADFVSTETKTVVEKVASRDSTYDQVPVGLSDIKDFFNRPVKIHSFVWTVGVPVEFTISPWNLFYDNVSVIRKTANFQWGRSDLKITIVINGTPFHYGRMLVSYNPWNQQTRGTTDAAILKPSVNMKNMRDSQRPHLFLDPATNQTLELTVPFFHFRDWFNMNQGLESKEIGDLTFRTLNVMEVASATASTTVSISVFASAPNIQLTTPTALLQSGRTKKGKSEVKPDGLVSSVASAVAQASGSLSKLPVIGKFATALEIGSGAVASIARLFGFARPAVITDPVFVKNQPSSSIAHVLGNETVSKLSLDPKHETTLDPTTVGLEDGDEMAIATIVGTETYFATVPWVQTAVPETILFWCNVTPMIGLSEPAAGAENYLQMTSTAFGSLPFYYWSGTLKYRIQVVASEYHRGRLRITYEPNGAAYDSSSYNTAMSQIIDLEATRDYTFDISYSQDIPYKILGSPAVINHYSPPGGIYNYNEDEQNGIFYVTVLNDLTAPLSTADIAINVFISAGEDFEIFCPRPFGTGFGFERLMFKPENVNAALAENVVEDKSIKLQSGRMTENRSIISNQHINLVEKPNLEVMKKKALIFAGEHIPSYRTLLKRYNLVNFFNFTGPAMGIPNNVLYRWNFSNFPEATGWQTATYNGNGSGISNSNTTLLSYLRSGYVAWKGSIRYKYHMSSTGGDNTQVTVGRRMTRITPVFSRENLNSTTNTVNAEAFMQNSNATWGGSYLSSMDNQPIIEVDLPYYNQFRFCVATQQDNKDGIDDGSNKMFHTITGQTNMNMADASTQTPVFGTTQYVATGEDFNLLWYIGAPTLVY
mgnify:CR=1 FL=1